MKRFSLISIAIIKLGVLRSGFIYMVFGTISIIFIQCERHEKYSQEYSFLIPEKDRYIFEEGSLLSYICNDGTIDTILVKEVRFYTKTWTSTTWFGNLIKYTMDIQTVVIEVPDDIWSKKLFFNTIGEYTPKPCYILTIPGYIDLRTDIQPTEIINNECNGYQGFILAYEDEYASTLVINNKEYNKVYEFGSGPTDSTSGYQVLWSLEYGIIQYSIPDRKYCWDFDRRL